MVKKCSKCGIEKSLSDFFARKGATDGKISHCKECKTKANYAWREKNMDRWLAYCREHLQRPHSKIRKAAYNRRPDIKEARRISQQDPKRKAARREYRKKNLWRWKFYYLQKAHARRAAMKGGRITAKEWDELKAMCNNRCAYCGLSEPLTMDHIVPLSRGGSHGPANILPACRSCNSSKKNKHLDDWLESSLVA